MSEHVIVEAVAGEYVCGQVRVVIGPVFSKFLGTENEHGLIAQFIIFDYSKGGEGLSQADAVGKDAAVVGLQFIDDPGGGVALKVVQRLPDLGVLIAGAVVGQDIIVDVVEELRK